MFGAVYYYDENGRPIGKSSPGLLEGTRVYTDHNGQYAGKSRPGFLAKKVFVDTDDNYITSYEGFCVDIHFQNGVPIGYTRPGASDAAHTTLETEDGFSEEHYDEDCEEEDLDEAWDEIEEDESYESDHEEDTSETYQYTILKNVLLFVLCLVICMFIVCIHAIFFT